MPARFIFLFGDIGAIMGLSLEFYLGNADAIADAVADIDLDRLDDPNVVTHTADFSLHITPADLDLLSESIGRVTDQMPQGLSSSLQPMVDEEDRGALLVSLDWIQYTAALLNEQVDEVAELWASVMRSTHGDEEIVVTDDMREAVDERLLLCRSATQGSRQVVHVWYL